MTLHVFALGAGLQSTTLVLLAAHGEIPKPDVAIFSDTGGEPSRVIQHLHWLAGVPFDSVTLALPNSSTITKLVPKTGVWQGGVLPFPVHVVRKGDLEMDLHIAAAKRLRRVGNPPVFVRSDVPDSPIGMVNRKCTGDYKVKPIRAEITRLAGKEARREWWRAQSRAEKLGHAPPPPLVVQSFGISLDEATRIKPLDRRWIERADPLVDMGMNREACRAWLTSHGYEIPGFSACVFCPFNGRTRFRSIRQDPDDWHRAVQVDLSIRHGLPGLDLPAYLSRLCRPLTDEDAIFGLRQMNIEDYLESGDEQFQNECSGHCGV